MRTVVINLPHRTDRRREMERQLARIGWSAEIFSAIRPSDAGNFSSIGARGCFLSHLAVLKQARDDRVDRLVVLEDDVTFVHDFQPLWSAAIAELAKRPWSFFYAGHDNRELPRGFSRVDPVTCMRCSHFTLINGAALAILVGGLETILSRSPGHPDGGPMHLDGAYSTLRAQNPHLATYAYSPALGYQRSSRSDIADGRWFDRTFVLAPLLTQVRRLKNAIVRS